MVSRNLRRYLGFTEAAAADLARDLPPRPHPVLDHLVFAMDRRPEAEILGAPGMARDMVAELSVHPHLWTSVVQFVSDPLARDEAPMDLANEDFVEFDAEPGAPGAKGNVQRLPPLPARLRSTGGGRGAEGVADRGDRG